MRFLFTTLPGIAHLHAMVPVARALTTAGHKTAFATSPSFCSTVEACGFESFACGLDWLESEFMENFPELRRMHPSSAQSAEFVMDLFAGRLAAAMVADLREVAGSWKPDVVVRDLLEFGGCLVAESLSLPHASCGPTYYSDRLAMKAATRGPLTRQRRALDLFPDPSLQMLYRHLDLAFGPPSFLVDRHRVPTVTHFLRPEVFDRSGDEELPAWFDKLPERPTILGTMGTVANRTPGMFEAIAAGLGDGPFDVILTVGRNRNPGELGSLPANVRAIRYVPYSLLLPRCDLVITHGGTVTVNACLMADLPMLVLPVAGDAVHQHAAMRRLRRGARSGTRGLLLPGRSGKQSSAS